MKRRVFLSYAHRDREHISKAITSLQGIGLSILEPTSVLIDPSDLDKTTSDIRAMLRDQIRTASLVLLFWSKQAGTSQWVRYELGMARAFGVPITVVIIDSYAPEVPGELSDSETINLEDLIISDSSSEVRTEESSHLTILRQGVVNWNSWRERNPFVRPNLKEADLHNLNLSGANLSETDLSGADLTGTYLWDTNLFAADLSRARLNRTNLFGTNFSEATFRGAVLTNAWLFGTVFGNTDLSDVVGLEMCRHFGPSTIDNRTLARNPHLPEVFLQGCGFSNVDIEYAKLHRKDLSAAQITNIAYKIVELRTDSAIQFHSCFISYSSQNEDFARKLHDDLQEIGVRCWFAPEDIRIGSKIRHAIDDAIRLHDKLLLILSKHTISSQWVEGEVERALEKEQRDTHTILFPVRIDDAVFDVDTGWVLQIKEDRHIGDFRGWENEEKYSMAFERLLRDLRAA